MFITPWLWTPFTDFTGAVHTFQEHPRCADLELRVADCMEAYAYNHGLVKCELLFKDFQECVFRGKRTLRIHHMKEERERQIKAGERKEPYEPCPALDQI